MSYTRYLCYSVLATGLFLSLSFNNYAQPQDQDYQDQDYVVPRTEYGHPDFQGVWMTNFVTMMERPEGITDLVVPADVAAQLASRIQGGFTSGVTDLEFIWAGEMELAKVRGEYRSSIVTYPEDGKIPWTESGLQLARQLGAEINGGVDGPEQRPVEERCLASMGHPPIRTLPIKLARVIVQNKDHMVFFTEDSAGMRQIRIGNFRPSEQKRRFEGYSVGQWEGETLVVTTTHFRADFPARINIPLPILLGANTTVVERFTRISEGELNYQFTVSDSDYYREPWSGEFSLEPFGDKSYEYGCHEGNYSLPAVLRGGIVTRLDSELVQ